MDPIELATYRPDLAGAFASLNREWIERLFRVEASDAAVLADPEGYIIRPGGQIFFALDNGTAVGTVAAVRGSNGVFELAKMAVSPAYQGRGLGERLGQAAVDFAREAGARMIFLETNSRLANAIRLYERLGFAHAPHPSASAYERSDVYMALHFR